jgi:biopolymer transport protein ExbB
LTFDPNYTALYHFDGATGTRPKTPPPTATLHKAPPARHRRCDRARLAVQRPAVAAGQPVVAAQRWRAFTFSAWLRLDQANGEQLFWPAAKAPTACWSGSIKACRSWRSTASAPWPPAAEPGQWQHLALTAEGESQLCTSTAVKAPASPSDAGLQFGDGHWR